MAISTAQDPNNVVTTNAPIPPNAIGGAPTTTQNVNGTIQLNPTPASAAQTTPSQNQPAPSTPAQPTAPSASQPAPRSLHSRIFDSILRTLAGPPVRVLRTDPTTGESQQVEVQQTRGQLGRSILAGALTGMFAGAAARDAEGRHDPMKAASEGFQAATQQREKQQQQAQNVEDENFARKQMTMKANLDLAHQAMALTMQKHAYLSSVADANNAGILADAKKYDGDLTDKTQPKAILQAGLTHQEALDALKGKWSNQLAVISGQTTDEKGDTVPLYTLLNPNVKVKMSEAQANEFGRFNPQFVDALNATSGNLQMSLANYVDATNKLNTLDHMESFFKSEAKGLGLKPDFDFATIVRNGRPKVYQAVLQAENALAGGGTPVDALRRMATASGGSQVLNAMGVTNDQVETLYNDQIAAQKIAAEAGKIAAQKAKPITFAAAPSITHDETETPERRAQAEAVIAENLNFKTKEAAIMAQFAATKPNPNMMTGSMPDGTQVAGTTDELTHAGATGITKLPAADQSKVSIARQLVSPNGLLTNTQKDIAAFKPEELTAIGNRWNEFEAGTLGSGDPRYIALRTDARLLSTALMQAHVGSRGSESIMEHFSNLADAGKMDGDALKTAIETERRYVTEKAMLPKAPTTQAVQKPNQPSDPAAAFGGKTRQ